METRTKKVTAGALQNLISKAAYECRIQVSPESANEFQVDFDFDSAFSKARTTIQQRFGRLGKRIFRCVRLAYVMPPVTPEKRFRDIKGLPTWRFDLTVIVAALVLGVPLLF
ncbi:MAG: hypothetical protein JWM11_6844 [Planctomycetaceae bacterium]|nr:hypothetical protein [Planctomycetaceae bacterium]